MQIPIRFIQGLGRLMRITGQTADGQMMVVLGHPWPATDWLRFVHQATKAGVEVVKQIRAGGDGRPRYSWRLSFTHPSALANALRDYARPSSIPVKLEPAAIDAPQSHPEFDDLLVVALVECSNELELVYGLPRGGLDWKDVVSGLLASGRALDIAKVHFVERQAGSVRYVWRVLWRPEGKPRELPVPPSKDPAAGLIVAQPEPEPPLDVEREQTRKAIELYRQRFGMTRDADGRWRVPLDPYGRITKAVLFDPERACRVSGIDYSKTGPITREMIERPERPERLRP